MAISIGFRSIKKIIAEKSEVTKVYVGDMMVYDRTTDPNLLLPLTFIAQEANSRVALTKTGSPAWEGEYSLDNENWLPYVPSTTGNITLANIGDRVYFRGNISNNFSASNYLKFSMTGRIWAEGNVNSMYVAVDFEELETLSYSYCYSYMFDGCTSLTTTPKLPATTLAEYCYSGMFRGCTSLTDAPELPAETLATRCYNYMFRLCTSLTAAPELSATTLALYCYNSMFRECTSLTTAPKLPATTLATNCYNSMFQSCSLIKVSLTKEGIYQNTWQFGNTLTSQRAASMFLGTGGTFTGTPADVDVLYTSNDLV